MKFVIPLFVLSLSFSSLAADYTCTLSVGDYTTPATSKDLSPSDEEGVLKAIVGNYEAAVTEAEGTLFMSIRSDYGVTVSGISNLSQLEKNDEVGINDPMVTYETESESAYLSCKTNQ